MTSAAGYRHNGRDFAVTTAVTNISGVIVAHRVYAGGPRDDEAALLLRLADALGIPGDTRRAYSIGRALHPTLLLIDA